MSSLMVHDTKITVAKDLVADGTSEVLTAVVDMQGYDEVCWIVDHGDVDAAAVMTYTVKENTADSTSSPTPTSISLVGVAQTGASLSSGALTITESSGNLDDGLVVVNVAKQAISKRYVFLSITVSAESHEIDSVICVQRKARDLPVTQGSDVVALAYAAK